MPLTMVDIVILVIVLISALMALLRGFVREMLTIVAWVAAAVVAIFLFPILAPIMRNILMPPLLADAVSGLVIFVIFLIPALILTGRAGSRFGRDDPGIVDRLGGFAFGVVRGLFIIGILYWGDTMLRQPEPGQGWLDNAALKPFVAAVASVLPEDVGALANSSQNRSGSESRGREPEPEPETSTNDDESDKGYGQTDRLGLDQLITTTNED